MWSDETKINSLGSDGRKWAWKRAGEGLSDRLVKGTVKFGGGSVMMWGCMFWDAPGYACKLLRNTSGRFPEEFTCTIDTGDCDLVLYSFGLSTSVKDGILGWFGFWVRILRDLASTYVLHRPCSSSLYFGISQSSGWSDLVVNEERNFS